MFTTILWRQLRNSEFIMYHRDVVKVCTNNNPVALKIDAQVNALGASIDALENLFAKERANALTAELVALDERRDRALIGMRTVADGYRSHFNDAIKNAGIVIVAAFDKYGTALAKMNYKAETEVIISLAGDLTTSGDLPAALRTLRMEDWVQELTAANTAFNNQYHARSSDYAAQPQGNFVSEREATMAVYTALLDHIFSHRTLNPSDAYTKLVNEMNTFTADYNNTVTSRGGEEEEVPPPQPGDAPPPAAAA